MTRDQPPSAIARSIGLAPLVDKRHIKKEVDGMSYIRSFFSNQTVKLYEPKARAWHYTTAVKGKCYCYGGCTTGLNASGKVELSSSVEVFDPLLEEWEALKCTGTTPKGLFGGGCCSSGDDLFVYGGTDGVGWCSGLYKLCTKSKSWSLLADVGTSQEGPMKKGGCRMVLFNEKYLALIGGYGQAKCPQQKGSTFIRNTSFTDSLRNTAGWSNEFHVFDLEMRFWKSPFLIGERPPPSDGFTFTSIDRHRAVLFGGILHDRRYNNSVYIINFQKMECQKFVQKSGKPWPIGRVEHAACCLGFGEHPHLLLIGGLYDGNKILKDAWLLDLKSMKWKELLLPEGFLPRCCHSLTANSFGNRLIEVTMFGGCAQYDPVKPAEALTKLAGTTIFRFEYVQGTTTMEWVLVDVAHPNEQGTCDRLRRKLVNMREIVCRQELQHSVQQFKETNKQLESALQDMRESNEEARVKLAKSEADCKQALIRAEQAQEQRCRAEKQAIEFEKIANAAEIRAADAEDQLQKIEMQWIIQKLEIHISSVELGRGGWAVVKVAEFRGTKVAAKCFYRELRSRYYQQMFAREMKMASQLRHPNLVQFIGATSLAEGEPIILTELMTTSLRDVLKAGPIDHRIILSISLDVIRALSYLHLMAPHPLIHRDISSANVLLNALPNNGWKAKVADYGSVNLVQKLQTVGPGNPVYAAPEATVPAQQSPKMDIYSYGVMLVEMLTDQFPEEESRSVLIESIGHSGFTAIVRRCLNKEKEKRPSAEQLLLDLSNML